MRKPVPPAAETAENALADEPPLELPARLTLTPGRSGRITATIHIKTEAEEEAEQLGASPMSSVLTLCNSAIGAGVLSLPYAFRLSGAVGCFLLCVALGVCEAFTLYVLSKFSERYRARTYSVLVRKALGRKLSALLSIIMVVYLWGSCIAYLVIIGDSFSPLLELAAGADSVLADRRLVIAALGVVVVLPLCFPRDLGALSWVLGFVFTACAVVARSGQIVTARADWSDVHTFNWRYDALFAIPIIVFGFNCHANVVTIFSELQDRPKQILGGLPTRPHEYAALGPAIAPRPRTIKLIGMLGVIISAVAIIMLGYLCVGLAGYLAFPTTVASNVLLSFPPDDWLMQIARGVIGLVVTFHYPLNHHPARLAAEHLEGFWFGWTSISRAFSVAQTCVFVAASLGVAMVVTDLGDVLHLVGGTAAAFMIFFLPGLLLVNAAIIKESASTADLAALEGGASVSGDGDVSAPLLARARELGIKRVGLIYSPRKSWWTGVFFVTLSIVIFLITIVTAVWK